MIAMRDLICGEQVATWEYNKSPRLRASNLDLLKSGFEMGWQAMLSRIKVNPLKRARVPELIAGETVALCKFCYLPADSRRPLFGDKHRWCASVVAARIGFDTKSGRRSSANDK